MGGFWIARNVPSELSLCDTEIHANLSETPDPEAQYPRGSIFVIVLFSAMTS